MHTLETPTTTWALRLDLTNPAHHRYLTDTHAAHRLVMTGFPDNLGPTPRAAHHILWAWTTDPDHPGYMQLLVRSTYLTPTWDPAFRPVQHHDPQPGEHPTGTHIQVALRAEPVKRSTTTRQHQPIDPHTWLHRRTTNLGLSINNITAHPTPTQGTRRGVPLRHHTVDFVFDAAITNPEAFTHAWVDGVGHGKAHGHGMIRIEPR